MLFFKYVLSFLLQETTFVKVDKLTHFITTVSLTMQFVKINLSIHLATWTTYSRIKHYFAKINRCNNEKIICSTCAIFLPRKSFCTVALSARRCRDF